MKYYDLPKYNVLIILFLTNSINISCNSGNFSGGPTKKELPPKPAQTSPAAEEHSDDVVLKKESEQSGALGGAPVLEPPATCKSKTVLKPLTTSVTNGSGPQLIKYEASLDRCPGSLDSIVLKELLFDLEASFFTGGITAPAYRIYDASAAMEEKDKIAAQGVFQIIRGSDLFGNQDKNYFHFKTEKILSSEKSYDKIIIEIGLGGVYLYRQDQSTGEVPKSFNIKSYFKLDGFDPTESFITFVNI